MLAKPIQTSPRKLTHHSHCGLNRAATDSEPVKRRASGCFAALAGPGQVDVLMTRRTLTSSRCHGQPAPHRSPELAMLT